MLISQGFQVPSIEAPRKMSAVPRKAKKRAVTPKKPTKNGPIQKSNRSPPISVPPRIRYFRSKLSSAIAGPLHLARVRNIRYLRAAISFMRGAGGGWAMPTRHPP